MHCLVRRFDISNRYQHKWYTKMNQITAYSLCRDLKQSIPEHNKQDIKARKCPVKHNLVCWMLSFFLNWFEQTKVKGLLEAIRKLSGIKVVSENVYIFLSYALKGVKITYLRCKKEEGIDEARVPKS